MKDRDRRGSGRLMLISPERVFYAGLLGRPRQRSSGGYNIYAAIRGRLTINDGQSALIGELALVPPYVAHSVESEHPTIICLVIEPETVAAAAMAELGARVSGREAPDLARAPAHSRGLRRYAAAGARPRLHHRRVRPDVSRRGAAGSRYRPPHQAFCRQSERLLRQQDERGRLRRCGGTVGIALLHLFKQQTGVSFRAFRAWKRARHLLHFVNEDINLAHLAQDIGYPNSTHFSHSIRRFYGLQPRAIFSGSRDLAIYRSDPGAPRPSR